jgi:cell wall assembly regulator SMI1
MVQDSSWERIERWLAVNAPEVADGLDSPASEEDIADAEQELGVRFPDSVRAAYLRHDGQRRDAPSTLYGWEWLSMARIREEWSVWKELLDGGDFDGLSNDADGLAVRSDWWHPAWIPLTYDGMGNHHCLDLAPGPGGAVGQVIEMWHDAGSRPVVGSASRPGSPASPTFWRRASTSPMTTTTDWSVARTSDRSAIES